jgi:hypothetical protein
MRKGIPVIRDNIDVIAIKSTQKAKSGSQLTQMRTTVAFIRTKNSYNIKNIF